MIILAYDHRAFVFMGKIKDYLKSKKLEFVDVSNKEYNSLDSYSEIAKLGNKLVENNIGIYSCGSGFGMCIAANRKKGVRAVLCKSELDAKLSRNHNNANVLVLSSDYTSIEDAIKIINTFFNEKFDGGRHCLRIQTLDE